MFTTRRPTQNKGPNTVSNTITHYIFYAGIVGGISIMGLTGCGQKGDLYLVNPSNQTVTNSSEQLDSGATPQDTAMADSDDDNYHKDRYLKQKQVFTDTSNDPNDY